MLHKGVSMPNPVSRLQLAQSEVDHVFGAGFAQANPALVAAVMASAASDHAAAHVAGAMECSAQMLADALTTDLPATNTIISRSRLMRP